MPRISTFGASQTALANLMQTQRDLFEAQSQLTTGKKATDLKGVGHQAETLSAARSALAQAKTYEEAGIRSSARLEAQDVALERLADSASTLRVAMTSADGDFIMDQVRDAFYSTYNALTTQHAGAYVFGGTRSDVNPLTINSLTDLVPLASVTDAFQNNSRQPEVQLDQNIKVKVGELADGVGQDVMASFKRIAEFEAGANGPFTQPMTPAQETFMRTELPLIVSALEGVNSKVGQSGANRARVETLTTSHQDRQTFLTKMLSDLEDVDMALAATRFQQAQVAIEVSAKTFSTLSQVSLLPFLR